MEFKERKILRDELLKKVYDRHFEHKGAATQVDKGSEDDENLLAYEYLSDKGLIRYEHFGGKVMNAKITSYGIDFIESGSKLSE